MVYSAGPGSLIEKLAAGFTAKTGEGQCLSGNDRQSHGAHRAEAANPVVDVLISASWDTATDFAKRDWLVAYTSLNAEKVPDFKNETAVAQGVSALGIAQNPASKTPKPAEWARISPSLNTRISSICRPGTVGSNLRAVATFRRNRAGTCSGTCTKMAQLSPVPMQQKLEPQSFRAPRPPCSLPTTSRSRARPVVIHRRHSTSGTVIAPRPAMIPKWSEEPGRSQAVHRIMLSDEGQKMVADTYLMPSRTDIWPIAR